MMFFFLVEVVVVTLINICSWLHGNQLHQSTEVVRVLHFTSKETL